MDRQQTFQRLKVPCVELLQVLAVLPHKPNARKDLVQALTHLLDTLRIIIARPGALDAKLAEYAFVPISQVLRVSGTVPVRALELCLECISSILSTGWGGALAPELSGQLLIFFTFMAKPSSAENGITATSEELQTLAFKCIAELFTQATPTPARNQFLIATANIPALGEAVLVMLDSLTESNSNNVKLQALAAIKALILALDDRDALASFLPRMMSALTKALTPSSASRASFRVLQNGLEIVNSLFLHLLSDRETRDLPTAESAETSQKESKFSRSSSWLRATATQIKIALANIFKLRHHDKIEVRQALLKLCLSIVQECRNSLSDCVSMAIETAITLAGRGGSNDRVEGDLKVLLSVDPTLSVLLRESLHGWVISLPRLMQSKDDTGRRQIIHQISVTLRLLDKESTTISDVLADNLRDGVSTIFTDSKGLEEIVGTGTGSSLEASLILDSAKSISFQPLRLRLKGQEDMMKEFSLLIQELAESQSALTVTQELIQTLKLGSQETQLASYWLSVNLLRIAMITNPAIDDFIDMGTPDLQGELLDDLYSHSLTILSHQEPGDEAHWHFSALALETVALQATRYKGEFRAELSEALYPVLHHLGSPNSALRQHAITCLNMIASACDYTSASDLVVANVDYIVNAVGLKLNYGDISPQAPQVLLMMMRLCGPSLLPYLDDLVDSIFGALERFHGYPRLVELLFSVLKGMVEEGVKTPQLAITAKGDNKEKKRITYKVSMADVIETIKKLETDAREREKDEEMPPASSPQKPWKELVDGQTGQEDDPDGGEQHSPSEPPFQPPPAPRTFEILLKISQLTQNYLTSSSSSLRKSLLSLLQTTVPALSKHEDSFLPLINTLWPVLTPRLEDPEAYVVSNALDIIALMCEHAGDFIRSRIEAIWNTLRAIYRRTSKRTDNKMHSTGKMSSTSLNLSPVQTGMKNLTIGTRPNSNPTSDPILYRPEMYVDAPTRMIWDSLVRLFCTIARYVAIREEHFDDMLNMLVPILEKTEVREALEERNADAVWLQLYSKSRLTAQTNEKNMDAATAPMNSVCAKIQRPVGKPHWNFVRL